MKGERGIEMGKTFEEINKKLKRAKL